MTRTVRSQTPAAPAPCGLHEDPVKIGAYTFQARRNAPGADDSRWQIFVWQGSGTVAYVGGYLVVHECPDEENRRPALTVLDTANRQIGAPNRPGRGCCPTSGPCHHHYRHALNLLWQTFDAQDHGCTLYTLEVRATVAELAREVAACGLANQLTKPHADRNRPHGARVQGGMRDIHALRDHLCRAGFSVDIHEAYPPRP